MLIIHGENTLGSRNFLNQKIQSETSVKNVQVVRLEGKTIKIDDVVRANESGGLFGNSQLIVLENFLVRPKSKEKSTIESYLETQIDQNIILWEAKKLTISQLGLLKKSQIQEFKNNPLIFSLLDSLGEAPAKPTRILQEIIQTDSPGSVFFMLCRQIRLLLQLDDPEAKTPPWQKNKLITQRKKIGDSRLLKSHTKLLSIDENLKTGKSALDLTAELELLIIQLYHG